MYCLWMQAKTQQTSGMKEEDVENAAHQLWEAEEGCRFALWDCMLMLKPVLELEDSESRRSRENPLVIPESSVTTTGQKKAKRIHELTAVKEEILEQIGTKVSTLKKTAHN